MFLSELLNSDHPPVTLPKICTLPSTLPLISTLPEPLLSSTRTGPETVRVRSNVLSAAEALTAAELIRAMARKTPKISDLRAGDRRLIGATLPSCSNVRIYRQLCSRAFCQGFVQGTLPVALQVQCHIRETRGLERLRKGHRHFRRHRPRHLFSSQFDSGQFIVQAHAELSKTQLSQGGLAAFD